MYQDNRKLRVCGILLNDIVDIGKYRILEVKVGGLLKVLKQFELDNEFQFNFISKEQIISKI